MRHLDEATILSVRDGGSVQATASAHIAACATCGAALTAAQARAEMVGRTLTALDGPIEATAAKAGVRARLRPSGNVHAPGRWGSRHLGRAAAVLLVTAGAAAALPGSPVRILWGPSTREPALDPPAALSVVGTQSTPSPDASSAGITVAVSDGFVQVVVRGAAPGSEVSVAWTDQHTASLTAPPGSRFTYSAGRVEVDASRGAVRMELPRDARLVSLEVDGDLYLTGSPGSLEVLGPAVERTDESIRFRVDER